MQRWAAWELVVAVVGDDTLDQYVFSMVILAVGIATVIGMILVLKMNAFIALITSSIVVSLLSNMRLMFIGTTDSIAWGDSISRVATEFGGTAGKIGVVIALASVIGKCMMDSGAADRIVRAFVGLLGEKYASVALMLSGFVLAVPVFFDTVFYLLVPLARSLYRRTNKNYLLYVLAISAGGAVTHTLVPPTPGPLAMAANLKFDVGWMIMIGILVGFPMAVVGLIFSKFLDSWMPVPMRQVGSEAEPEPLKDDELPSLFWSALPVVLPVRLISMNTVVSALGKLTITPETSATMVSLISFCKDRAGPTASILGDANLALLLSTAIAMIVLFKQRGLDKHQMAQVVETSLMSGGVIILITSAGGSFGAMLKQADLQSAIDHYSGNQPAVTVVADGTDTPSPTVTEPTAVAAAESAQSKGLYLILLGFGIAVVLKIAQGSSTVAMVTVSGMMATMIGTPESIGFHPVYIAISIGSGSLVGSWMNDSGFWIFAKMGGLTETEALKSWSLLLIALGSTGLVMTLILSRALPLI